MRWSERLILWRLLQLPQRVRLLVMRTVPCENPCRSANSSTLAGNRRLASWRMAAIIIWRKVSCVKSSVKSVFRGQTICRTPSLRDIMNRSERPCRPICTRNVAVCSWVCSSNRGRRGIVCNACLMISRFFSMRSINAVSFPLGGKVAMTFPSEMAIRYLRARLFRQIMMVPNSSSSISFFVSKRLYFIV